ncbi:MAG: hypothetical protein AAF567_19155 [Actinomycetota bacterium]
MFAHPSFAALAVGVLAVSLLGSGLFAVITDSVTIENAVAETDDYTAPSEAELDLEIGPITGGEDAVDPCLDAFGVTYTDSDAINASAANQTLEIARFYTDPDYAAGNTPSAITGQYCIKNVSDAPGAVQMQLLSWSSTEVGDCGPTEALVDTSCVDGDPGELGLFGSVEPFVFTAFQSPCAGVNAFRRVDWNPVTQVGQAFDYDGLVLQPGEACLIGVGITGTRSGGVTPDEWQQVVTDTGEFAVAINLVEAP